MSSGVSNHSGVRTSAIALQRGEAVVVVQLVVEKVLVRLGPVVGLAGFLFHR